MFSAKVLKEDLRWMPAFCPEVIDTNRLCGGDSMVIAPGSLNGTSELLIMLSLVLRMPWNLLLRRSYLQILSMFMFSQK